MQMKKCDGVDVIKGNNNASSPCQNQCKALIPHSWPEKSEWYCEGCHVSYPMSRDTTRGIMDAIARR